MQAWQARRHASMACKMAWDTSMGCKHGIQAWHARYMQDGMEAWDASMACKKGCKHGMQDGIKAWDTSMGCKHGMQAWHASMACKHGMQDGMQDACKMGCKHGIQAFMTAVAVKKWTIPKMKL